MSAYLPTEVKQRLELRLTTILGADVVGTSHLMEADEVGTMNALKSDRDELINPPVAVHNGRIVKLMGDGALTRNLTAGVASAAKFGTREQARLATLPARDTRKLCRSKHP